MAIEGLFARRQEPVGNMITDIGGGTTVLSCYLSGRARFFPNRSGLLAMKVTAPSSNICKTHSSMIGERIAEEIMRSADGSAFPLEEELQMDTRGRDLISGLPKTISITSVEIREALHDPVQTIVDASKTTLEQTPPELAADLIDRGIVMAGGGSLLRGLDKRIAEETGLPVHIADDPFDGCCYGEPVRC